MNQQSNWAQYRKFSAAPSARQVVIRSLAWVGIVTVLLASWMPSDDRMLPPPDMHVVTYVELPRVEITARPDHLQAEAPGAIRSAWIKFVQYVD